MFDPVFVKSTVFFLIYYSCCTFLFNTLSQFFQKTQVKADGMYNSRNVLYVNPAQSAN